MEALRTLIEALPCHNSLLLHNFDYVKLLLPGNSPNTAKSQKNARITPNNKSIMRRNLNFLT